MKMQESKMEFVSFDAGDVIATSTPSDPLLFIQRGSLSLLNLIQPTSAVGDFGLGTAYTTYINGSSSNAKPSGDEIYCIDNIYSYDFTTNPKKIYLTGDTVESAVIGSNDIFISKDGITQANKTELLFDVLSWLTDYGTKQ